MQLTAPVASAYVPSAHDVHAVALLSEVYVPFAHGAHSVSAIAVPAFATYVPGAQSFQGTQRVPGPVSASKPSVQDDGVVVVGAGRVETTESVIPEVAALEDSSVDSLEVAPSTSGSVLPSRNPIAPGGVPPVVCVSTSTSGETSGLPSTPVLPPSPPSGAWDVPFVSRLEGDPPRLTTLPPNSVSRLQAQTHVKRHRETSVDFIMDLENALVSHRFVGQPK